MKFNKPVALGFLLGWFGFSFIISYTINNNLLGFFLNLDIALIFAIIWGFILGDQDENK